MLPIIKPRLFPKMIYFQSAANHTILQGYSVILKLLILEIENRPTISKMFTALDREFTSVFIMSRVSYYIYLLLDIEKCGPTGTNVVK